ncbi:hypothetical protein C0J52_06203 [Blattella germanica]|nr:hypothetical protein C0J52_06203 [Blattella germanica]
MKNRSSVTKIRRDEDEKARKFTKVEVLVKEEKNLSFDLTHFMDICNRSQVKSSGIPAFLNFAAQKQTDQLAEAHKPRASGENKSGSPRQVHRGTSTLQKYRTLHFRDHSASGRGAEGQSDRPTRKGRLTARFIFHFGITLSHFGTASPKLKANKNQPDMLQHEYAIDVTEKGEDGYGIDGDFIPQRKKLALPLAASFLEFPAEWQKNAASFRDVTGSEPLYRYLRSEEDNRKPFNVKEMKIVLNIVHPQ